MKQTNERTVRNIRFWRAAVVLLMLIPLLEVLILLPSLPDTIAVHWGVSGTPDRYGSRYELLIPAAIVILVGSLLLKDSFGRQPKGIKAGGILTLVIFNVIQPMILYMTVNPQINILDLSFGRVVCGLMSLVIIVTGNYLPKVSWEYRFKRKHGFRTRYALSDENVWMHTQRFAGYGYITAGLIGLVSAVFLPDLACVIVLIVSMILVSILIYYYSWSIWKEMQDNLENFRQK